MAVDSATRKKAISVLARHGKAPNVAAAMDAEELTVLASLIGHDGLLIAGAGGLYQKLMIEHYERLKATDAEFD